MAEVRKQKASWPKQLANFTNSTAGLDLTLRLLHSLVIIGAEISTDKQTVAMNSMANMQINLGRRYLRFFCFLDCFHSAYQIFTTQGKALGTIAALMDLVEATCLGLYLIIENSTMLHDLQIWQVSWYNPVLVEANKFWFYAIAASIIRTLALLLFSPSKTKASTGSKGKKKRPEAQPAATGPSASQLLRKLSADIIDLALPASFIGWVAVSDLTIGYGMLVSTILVWPDMWAKYQ